MDARVPITDCVADFIGGSSIDNIVARMLLDWYGNHARVLPWRAPPGTLPDDPWRVVLSEIMLQQTSVASVIPRFESFIARWSSVAALAAADDADVMAAWAGLGYYARARRLLACARAVVAMGGGFPDSEKELRLLPGLGAYSAAAVAAIAFGRRAVVVDANVVRVVARLFAIAEPLPGAMTAIRAAADKITPDLRAGDFAQAMMDLASSICLPRRPRCPLCPLAGACRARMRGDAEDFPHHPPKLVRPHRQGRAFWIDRSTPMGDEVWLVRRPVSKGQGSPTGMLAGMRALPDDGWTARADGDSKHGDSVSKCAVGCPPLAGPWRSIGAVRHGFTHCMLRLDVSIYEGHEQENLTSVGDGQWWPLERITDAGLPSLFARAAELVMADRESHQKETTVVI